MLLTLLQRRHPVSLLTTCSSVTSQQNSFFKFVLLALCPKPVQLAKFLPTHLFFALTPAAYLTSHQSTLESPS